MAKFRKLIALLLVVVMSFSLLGVTGAFAQGVDGGKPEMAMMQLMRVFVPLHQSVCCPA